MKTISKLFMAVVAGVLAFSCVTDTTEDLGVNLGEGQTTLSISLEESRTHLGVKAPNGEEYPLYWSEGDKIAVNGKASDALGEEYHGQTQATFKFTGTLLNYPYNIFYPAPAEGVTAEKAGNYPVTFKTSQVYTEGSFAEGSVPMYGYVEDENDATTLNHLTGVLRIALYGTGVTLNAMTLSAESGKLSGNFDVNCTTGDLTAHADASNTLSVSFGTGLTIATTEAEATPIYVAVPEGDYGKITITFYSSKGAMTKSFDTTEKPITAGSVREFAALEYVEGTTDTFIIYDEALLRTFANSINDTNAENVAAFNTTYPNARVVADITLSDTEAWTSINGYTGSFDGGNHTISGLKASLFGETQASAIKNVHLDVDIEIAENKFTSTASKPSQYFYGALAHYVNNASATIENCSVSGDISVDVTGSDEAIYVAAMIGKTNTASQLSNLVNKANLTIEGTWAKGGYVAGCVANPASHIYNCHNRGTLDFKANHTAGTMYGFCGISGTGAKKISYCTNGSSQDPEIGKIVFSGSSAAYFYMGGIASTAPSAEHCTNYAKIEANGTSSNRLAVVGCIAYHTAKSISYCENYGPINVNTSGTIASLYANGICIDLAKSTQTRDLLSNCTNHGAITVSSDVNATTIYAAGIINVVSYKYPVSNLTNKGNITVNGKGEDVLVGGITTRTNNATYTGTFKNEGVLKFDGQYTTSLEIGGTFARLNGSANVADATFVNTGNITCTGTGTGETKYIGGLVGNLLSTIPLLNDKCYCAIDAKGYENVGMITGVEYNGSTNCHVGGSILKGEMTVAQPMERNNYYNYVYGSEAGENAGTIVIVDECGWLNDTDKIDAKPLFATNVSYNGETTEDLYVIKSAGDLANFAAAVKGGTLTQKKAIVTADIDMADLPEDTTWEPIGAYTGTFDGKDYTINGLTAPLFGTTKASVIKNVRLTGVNITSNLNPLGALACKVDNAAAVIQNCSADGELTFANSSLAVSEQPYVGGIIGQTTTTTTITGLVNSVDVDFQHSSGVLLGGCIGTNKGDIDDCHNVGTITYSGNGGTSDKTIFLSGICGWCIGDVKNCTNGSWDEEKKEPTQEGKIEFKGSMSSLFIVSGIAGPKNAKQTIDCINYAPINIAGKHSASSNSKYLQVAGINAIPNYGERNGAAIRCSNYGKITITTDCSSMNADAMLAVGGVTGGYGTASTVTDCANYGDIEIDLPNQTNTNVYIGGVLSIARSGVDLSGSKNTGNIIVAEGCTTAEKTYIGGIAGQSLATINKTCCLCNIQAVGFTNVGMVTGSTRVADTVVASNCAVGGSIATRTSFQGGILGPHTIELKADNYYKYIYGRGTETDWTGTENHDGCTFDPTEVAPLLPEEE
ncbi:MAG: hypothetical protein IKA04_04325 [Alistipes sp.]|nr:hypothetical protein [Alistipes sp.]